MKSITCITNYTKKHSYKSINKLTTGIILIYKIKDKFKMIDIFLEVLKNDDYELMKKV